MENNNESNSFFDKKNLLTIALVGVVFFGWQMYLAKKYPKTTTNLVATENQSKEVANNNDKSISSTASTTKQADEKSIIQPSTLTSVEEKMFNVENNFRKLEVSNLGLGIKKVELKSFKTRENLPVFLGNSNESLVFLSLNGSSTPIPFTVEKTAEDTFVGKYAVNNTQIEAKLELSSSNYGFNYSVKILSAGQDFKTLNLNLVEKKIDQTSGSMFSPPTETQEIFVKSLEKTERLMTSATPEKTDVLLKNGNVVGISSHYFTASVVDKSAIIPEVLTKVAGEKVLASFVFTPPEIKPNLEFNTVGYIGPKSVKDLDVVSADLSSVINLGFFGSIAKVLLNIMSWFYSYVGNWGLAIILLTLLVRLVVLPFNVASFKSMKKMQKIQPLMQSIREKYKDDPTTQQREIMAVMKENKVNPLGGCLPMLLQMPVFFALYQCIGQSIELYQMPFFGWIHDLSAKDPLYVFPVLMGATMFIQQKITPSTMDPQQAKIMQFLPLMFALMMFNLPSGLTIYMFISTLFGVIQQMLFMKNKEVAQ